MMHRAWSSIVEVPYCFSRSYVKLQGHTALNIVKFDPNWAFPDCNSSLNSPMAMKCCTKLETAKERCPIVFQGHPSNFKVTRYKTSLILTQIGRFRTIGRSQLSNPSDLPCWVSVQNLFAFGLCWPNFGHLVAIKWLKMVVYDHYLKKYSCNPIQTWCIYLLGRCSELMRFGATLAKFWTSGGHKITENVGFRPLSEKVFMQSNSNMGCTLIGWVFRIDSLLGHVGQIFAL